MASIIRNVLYNIVAAYNKQETEQGLDMKVVQYIAGRANISVMMEGCNHITERARIEDEIAKLDSMAANF